MDTTSESGGAGLLTLEELTARVGMSVRNVRFYTTKGLVPPPIRQGRSGYYSDDHVARLELVRELQREWTEWNRLRNEGLVDGSSDDEYRYEFEGIPICYR